MVKGYKILLKSLILGSIVLWCALGFSTLDQPYCHYLYSSSSKAYQNKRLRDFADSLIEGRFVSLMKDKGIDISKMFLSIRANARGQRDYAFDLLGVDDGKKIIVLVETTFRLEKRDIDNVASKVLDFSELFPEYSDYKVYGAIGYIREGDDPSVPFLVERAGLFLIKGLESDVKMISSADFFPRVFLPIASEL